MMKPQEEIDPTNSTSVGEEIDPEQQPNQIEGSVVTEDEQSTTVCMRRKFPTKYLQYAVVVLGFVVGFILCFVTIDNNRHINQTLAIAIWMATLWLTEAIPLVVTAFLPLVLFPLFGILKSSTVATQYINNTIVLLMSGFLVALTLERWNLHQRLSLKILSWFGSNRPSLLLLGMMFPTFFLSMFISNTATTLMMVPNALSIVSALEKKQKNLESSSTATSTNTAAAADNENGGNPDEEEEEEHHGEQTNQQDGKFATALLLGIAYAANVGGMSSLIGTAPNLVFQRQLELFFPDAPSFTFADWIAFGLPTGVVMFLVIWAYLSVVYLRSANTTTATSRNNQEGSSSQEKRLFRDMYTALGAWSNEQIAVALLFLLLCLLWLFRADLNFGSFTISGWSNIFPEPSYVSDGTTGMLIVLILFVLPARSTMLGTTTTTTTNHNNNMNNYGDTVETTEEQETDPLVQEEQRNKYDTTLLDWETANQMPYDVIFLLGGGFALAKAFVESGLSEYLGDQLANLNLSLAALVFIMIFLIIWLTELTSNTSTSNIFVPLAASLAVATQASPYTFMIPATMACSCAFVLPIATPPNTVVFSTGLLPMKEMNKAGIFLNIIGSLVLFAAAYTIIPAALGVDAEEYPSWAESNAL